jgi:hypothetical protein
VTLVAMCSQGSAAIDAGTYDHVNATVAVAVAVNAHDHAHDHVNAYVWLAPSVQIAGA